MSDRIVDTDAIIWMVETGGEVTKDTIIALCNELKSMNNLYDRLRMEGCGYVECGMADRGFSNCGEEEIDEFGK
jgi:hypothetical protein